MAERSVIAGIALAIASAACLVVRRRRPGEPSRIAFRLHGQKSPWPWRIGGALLGVAIVMVALGLASEEQERSDLWQVLLGVGWVVTGLSILLNLDSYGRGRSIAKVSGPLLVVLGIAWIGVALA
jgi:hypothetical protein